MAQWQATENLLTTNDSGRRGRPARFVAVHTTEGGDTVRGIAEWQLKRSAQSSYHLLIARDGTSIRSNDDPFIPWSAMATGNRTCYHVALAGRAALKRKEWLARGEQLDTLADVLAHYSAEYSIPLRKVGAAALRAGTPGGVVGHADISEAWRETDHWDPGPDFPYDDVLRRARERLGVAPGSRYVVRPGDTLYRIALDHGTTWRELAELNGIPEPFLIHPGRELRIP